MISPRQQKIVLREAQVARSLRVASVERASGELLDFGECGIVFGQRVGERDPAEPGDRPFDRAADGLLRRKPDRHFIARLQTEGPIEPDTATRDAADARSLYLAIDLQQRMPRRRVPLEGKTLRNGAFCRRLKARCRRFHNDPVLKCAHGDPLTNGVAAALPRDLTLEMNFSHLLKFPVPASELWKS